ncbi:SH3 domain-containing protein [Fictibacillus sp. JL2B1089]|uniref:SH3 domain-containing protein n=1 Tax=Fictibacillus sp. JL2B1089 TaxID=3399565 RepID=UPI003A8905AD
MAIKKRWAAGLLGVGVMFGSLTTGASAESNVLLASVEWVNAQINPMKTKLSTLEEKIEQQQKQIEQLKSSGTKGDTSTPPSTPPDKMPNKVYVNTSSAKFYSGAATSYKLVAQKGYGSTLSVVTQFKASTGLWYRIDLGKNTFGWVNANSVSTKFISATNPKTVTTKSTVNIRRGASTSYKVVTKVSSGTKLKYINKFTTTNGEPWYNVETSAGLRGWIAASFGEVK